jgi:hypothetical protein
VDLPLAVGSAYDALRWFAKTRIGRLAFGILLVSSAVAAFSGWRWATAIAGTTAVIGLLFGFLSSVRRRDSGREAQ